MPDVADTVKIKRHQRRSSWRWPLLHKVNKVPGLDIFPLAAAFTSYCVEQFKGLSCCVPPGGSLSIHLVCPEWFSLSFFLFALICAAVWQVNGAQQQTAHCDLQSDLIQPRVFVPGRYADRGWCSAPRRGRTCDAEWLHEPKNWLVISLLNVYVCFLSFFFFFLLPPSHPARSHELTARPITAVICGESSDDIFTITELGRSVFICGRISVYHVKHLHLIEFQMLSGIVMKPGSYCYGNLGWVWEGRGRRGDGEVGVYMVSPQKSSLWHFNVCYDGFSPQKVTFLYRNCKYWKLHCPLTPFYLFWNHFA